VDVRRLVSGLEQVLYGTRRGAAVPEPGHGTGYSSGTAAVDRLVGATNGAGMPMPMPVPAGPQGMPGVPQPLPQPVPQPLSPPLPAPQPAAAVAASTPPGVPAQGGLTAAQVRGTNGLTPAPATGWPAAAG
jgi:hypothetical protein